MLTDSFSEYGHGFQIKILAACIVKKEFLQQIYDILLEEYFDSPANKWIVNRTIKYYNKYKGSPTPDYFIAELHQEEDEVLVEGIKDSLLKVKTNYSAPDLEWVMEDSLKFCRNQKMKRAVYECVDLLKAKNYDGIRTVINDALQSGIDKSLGLDWKEDIDHRYSVQARNPIPTGFEQLDSLTDGGLAPGELGVIVSDGGGGKCVGPNTLIDIEYDEIGIEFINNGIKSIIWLNPWDQFEIEIESQHYSMSSNQLAILLEKLTSELENL